MSSPTALSTPEQPTYAAATVREALHAYGWCPDQEAWVADQPSPAQNISQSPPPRQEWPTTRPLQPPPRREVSEAHRIGTLNVLADSFPLPVELAISSYRRIPVLVSLIEHADMDVLGLNEVTSNILQHILNSPVVRHYYQVSHLPATISKPHCAVLLSRLPMRDVVALESSRRDDEPPARRLNRHPIVATVQLSHDVTIDVCAIHTIAHQNEQNKLARRRQLMSVAKYLRNRAGSEWLMMGDMNLHYVNEDAIVSQIKALDTWAETHFHKLGDQNPGFTFDASTNAMIPRYIPGERRQMRLDRILIAQEAHFSPAAPCYIWADTAVDAASPDVFLSDHYGLFIELKSKTKPWTGDDDVKMVLAEHAARENEPNHFSIPRFLGALVGHSAWLLLRAVNLA